MKKIIKLEDFKKLKVGDQFLITSLLTGKDEKSILLFKHKSDKYSISDNVGKFRMGDNHQPIYAKDCNDIGNEQIFKFNWTLECGSLNLDEVDIENLDFIKSLNIRKLSKSDPNYSVDDKSQAKKLDDMLKLLFEEYGDN